MKKLIITTLSILALTIMLSACQTTTGTSGIKATWVCMKGGGYSVTIINPTTTMHEVWTSEDSYVDRYTPGTTHTWSYPRSTNPRPMVYVSMPSPTPTDKIRPAHTLNCR